jgi:hypothetical protein
VGFGLAEGLLAIGYIQERLIMGLYSYNKLYLSVVSESFGD